MRKLTSILLLLIYVLPALFQLQQIVDYAALEIFTPPDYIINRDEPELSCNGFRFLNQKIWESANPDDDSNQTPATVQNQRSVYLTMDHFTAPSPGLSNQNKQCTHLCIFVPTPYLKGVFHPPKSSFTS